MSTCHTHHYSKNPRETITQIESNARKARHKTILRWRIRLCPTADVRDILDAVIRNDISGALIWSLRFRSSSGGIYWHSEPLGATSSRPITGPVLNPVKPMTNRPV
jgi:hypothetical protein